MRNYLIYLEDIIAAMESIKTFVQGLSFNEFEHDDKTRSAVIQKFEIIGEAANQIPPTVTEKYKDVPWDAMVGMRNKLIHHYFGVDYQLVWETIHTIMPEVETRLKTVLDGEKSY